MNPILNELCVLRIKTINSVYEQRITMLEERNRRLEEENDSLSTKFTASSCDVSDLNSKIKNLENDKLSLITAIKLIQVRRTISILKLVHAANRRGLIAILLPTSWTNKCRS